MNYSNDEERKLLQLSKENNVGVMKFYFNKEACKIEHQTEWMKLYEEESFTLLANGKHIYFSY